MENESIVSEGHEAAKNGKSLNDNPYNSLDHFNVLETHKYYWWNEGYSKYVTENASPPIVNPLPLPPF